MPHHVSLLSEQEEMEQLRVYVLEKYNLWFKKWKEMNLEHKLPNGNDGFFFCLQCIEQEYPDRWDDVHSILLRDGLIAERW